MQRRAASALHLALFLLGAVLYFVFILPRWWVLTGDIPTTLATAGRIAAGVPIALAGVPVVLNLRESVKTGSGTPELALRLRAWSSVLHVLAGVLIILTAIVEIWVGLDTAGPWLFAVYGAAAAIAVLGIAALYLSRVAEKPPAEPKPPKAAKPPKAPKEKKRRKRGSEADETVAREEVTAAGSDEEVVAAEQSTDVDAADVETQIAETDTIETDADATEVVETEVIDTELSETEVRAAEEPASGGLRNKRPTGKSRHRLPR